MTKFHKNILSTIGRTPLVQIQKIISAYANVLAKLEYFNPLSSIKDRIGLAMIEDAEARGMLKEETLIVEPTSGNTGIALAFVCGVKGYKLALTMPESMSEERRKLLKVLGADLILTPANEGMNGAINYAQAMAEDANRHGSHKHIFLPQQFNNPANPEIHRRTTAVEIWNDTEGKVDILIVGVGTGGTLTGTAEVLKERNPNLKAIAVEPVNSPVISQALAGEELKAGSHGLMGIGAGFIPKVLNLSIIDEVQTVSEDEAYHYSREAAKQEGIFCGISSGAALCAADRVARRPENKDKNIVVIIPSCGERYLSTPLYKF